MLSSLLEDSVTTVTANGDGAYEYEFSVDEQTSIMYFYQENIRDGRDVMISYTDYDELSGQFRGLFITVLTENGDGTANVETYHKDL